MRTSLAPLLLLIFHSAPAQVASGGDYELLSIDAQAGGRASAAALEAELMLLGYTGSASGGPYQLSPGPLPPAGSPMQGDQLLADGFE